MKKLFIIVSTILGIGLSAKAQSDNRISTGLNFNVGVGDSYTNIGLGGKIQYQFAESWRGETSFNYFFKKDFVDMWEANLNAHYLAPIGGNFVVYLLAGPTLHNATVNIMNYSRSSTRLGVNYGVGVDYHIYDAIKLNLEIKGVTIGNGWGTRGELTIGAAYCF